MLGGQYFSFTTEVLQCVAITNNFIKEQTYTVQYQFIYEIVVVFQSFWVDLSSSIYTMWYQ